MKVSVSLPADDVKFLDELAAQGGYSSRSGVVAAAIHQMRQLQLTESYVEAFDEWAASDDAKLWDNTLLDGLADVPGFHDAGPVA